MQAQAEGDHVPGGRDLGGVGKAGRVLEGGGLHAEVMGLGGHQASEVGFGAAELLGESDGDVVGGLGDEGLDGVLDGDVLAHGNLELGGGGVGGVGADLDPGRHGETAVLKRVEGEIERHHLGEGGGMARLVAVLVEEDVTGVGVNDEERMGTVGAGWRGGGEGKDGERENGQQRQQL